MKRVRAFLFILLFVCLLAVAALAADKQYAYTLDYSALPSDIFKRQITINVSVGTASSCVVTADGISEPCTYTAGTGICAVTLTNTAANLVVTALNWTTGGTGAATKATLLNNKKWAYSFTFDDGYATDYTVDYPMFSAKNFRAGMSIVTSWIGNGNYMNRTQLSALFNAGWSVFNHSVSHPQNTINCSNLSTQILPAKTTLESWFPNNYKNIFYVYPYLETGYETCLSTAGYFHGAEGVDGLNYADNFTTTNFFSLYRHGLYASVSAAQANAWADAAANSTRPTWMITYTHMTYSGSSTPGTYDTNVATLSAHINYVYNTYGEGGTANNMWFAPSDEVLMYLFTRQYLVISQVSLPTPTSTPVKQTATNTYTPIIPTITPTATTTATTTVTNTASFTATFSLTTTPVILKSPTTTQSNTITVTQTFTENASPSYTTTLTCTLTKTVEPTVTIQSASETFTQTFTPTLQDTITKTQTETPSITVMNSKTLTPEATLTATLSATQTFTQNETATFTFTQTTFTNTATPSYYETAVNTQEPSATLTLIPSLTLTATEVMNNTATATTTQTATAIASQIYIKPNSAFTIAVLYPNPYNPEAQDLKIAFQTVFDLRTIRFELFTTGFRLISYVEENGTYSKGINVLSVDKRYLQKMSNGPYYYRLIATTYDNTIEKSKIGTVLVINN